MTSEQLKTLLYEFLWFEEGRAEQKLHRSFNALCVRQDDKDLLHEYMAALYRFDEFKYLQGKIFEILRFM